MFPRELGNILFIIRRMDLMDYEQRADSFIEDYFKYFEMDVGLKKFKEMLIAEYKQLIEDYEEDKKDDAIYNMFIMKNHIT